MIVCLPLPTKTLLLKMLSRCLRGEILKQAVEKVLQILSQLRKINLDYNDIKPFLQTQDQLLWVSAEASGKSRQEEAALRSTPSSRNFNQWCKGVLFSVASSGNLLDSRSQHLLQTLLPNLLDQMQKSYSVELWMKDSKERRNHITVICNRFPIDTPRKSSSQAEIENQKNYRNTCRTKIRRTKPKNQNQSEIEDDFSCSKRFYRNNRVVHFRYSKDDDDWAPCHPSSKKKVA